MSSEEYQLRQLLPGEAIPYDLLLLADETKEAIDKYIHDSDIYTVYGKGHPDPIGVFALCMNRENEIEIKNIAILESFRGCGIGTFLLEKIDEIASRRKYQTIIVGTGDAGAREIRFYEKNGFVKFDIIKDFYIHNYTAPITENGTMLKDMVMLKKQIR